MTGQRALAAGRGGRRSRLPRTVAPELPLPLKPVRLTQPLQQELDALRADLARAGSTIEEDLEVSFRGGRTGRSATESDPAPRPARHGIPPAEGPAGRAPPVEIASLILYPARWIACVRARQSDGIQACPGVAGVPVIRRP